MKDPRKSSLISSLHTARRCCLILIIGFPFLVVAQTGCPVVTGPSVIYLGDKKQYSAKNGSGSYKWSVNTTKVTIDNDGFVTGNTLSDAIEDVTITATDSTDPSKTGSLKITVGKAVLTGFISSAADNAGWPVPSGVDKEAYKVYPDYTTFPDKLDVIFSLEGATLGATVDQKNYCIIPAQVGPNTSSNLDVRVQLKDAPNKTSQNHRTLVIKAVPLKVRLTRCDGGGMQYGGMFTDFWNLSGSGPVASVYEYITTDDNDFKVTIHQNKPGDPFKIAAETGAMDQDTITENPVDAYDGNVCLIKNGGHGFPAKVVSHQEFKYISEPCGDYVHADTILQLFQMEDPRVHPVGCSTFDNGVKAGSTENYLGPAVGAGN